MAANVVDLSKLKKSLEFMTEGAKQYHAKVKELKEKQAARDREPTVDPQSSFNTNGDTKPFE